MEDEGIGFFGVVDTESGREKGARYDSEDVVMATHKIVWPFTKEHVVGSGGENLQLPFI